MCTSPITVKHTYKGNSSIRFDVVPCGKCSECRAKAQSEFAALSVLEAESAGSIGFLTLTYNNDSLPIALSTRFESEPALITAIERGSVWNPGPVDGSFMCSPICKGSFYICPSLCRSDVQKHIKRFRQDYFRRHGERCDFRFTFFGEYGERFKRPHYHMLIYGLDETEVRRFADLWTFGFTQVSYVTHFNADGSDAFAKVSRYVSKYVGKRDFLPDFVQAGFAEKPRKQSSIRLGVRDIKLEDLTNFILPEIIRAMPFFRGMKLL